MVTQKELDSWYEPREYDEKPTEEELDQKMYNEIEKEERIAGQGQY